MVQAAISHPHTLATTHTPQVIALPAPPAPPNPPPHCLCSLPLPPHPLQVNWDYDDALLTADRAVFFKYMARTLAEAHGLRATFMPKPFAGLTGSGCHAHVSLVSTTGQKQNVCGGGEAAMHGLSVTALKFLGGLLAHAPGYTAITNPSVNSFKRLNARCEGRDTPIVGTWGNS